MLTKASPLAGTHRNLEFLRNDIVWDSSITEQAQLVLADAQTSGGLLISVPKEKAHQLAAALEKAQVPVVAVVGEIVEDPTYRIQVTP